MCGGGENYSYCAASRPWQDPAAAKPKPSHSTATVGAANVGQQFTDTRYFWGRPSAVDYNGGGSGGSNKAATNPEYLAEVERRVQDFLAAHPYLTREEVPSEMVTASGSGLDPDISPRARRCRCAA